MKIQIANMTVRDYHRSLVRKEIRVSRDYQRSNQVWPLAARSYLIETMYLDFPIPKFFLRQISDIVKDVAYKEIVDGQQRTNAIDDFLNDKFSLSTKLQTEELRGRRFSEMDPDDQSKLLDYGLSCDLFVATSETEIREIFRRMNSYTVPLNDEEHRHAVYQGDFKWLIHGVARDIEDILLTTGVFAQRAIIRMKHTKLLAEISHAMLNGVQTTNRKKLDDLYKKCDKGVPSVLRDGVPLRNAFDWIASAEWLHGTSMMKQYNVYALVLALVCLSTRVPNISSQGIGEGPMARMPIVSEQLSALIGALEEGDETGPLGGFVKASTSRTNVGSQRLERLRWILRALRGQL